MMYDARMFARPRATGVTPPPTRPERLVLLGHPVAHSLSPAFQNAALDAAGLTLRYEAVDVVPDHLARTFVELRRARAAGNVTVPHKAAVADACDILTELASTVGAVNTFWCADDGALVGDNTDVAGATAALHAFGSPDRHGVSPRIAMLGAGGAAAAVVAAATATWPAASLTVWARGAARAAALADRFPGRVSIATTLSAALDGAQLVLNATPLGLADDALPCAIKALPPNAAVLDLVYGRAETAWVRLARSAGHAAQDGLLMLVEQGAAAFSRWFSREPDRARMWAAVEERTGRPRPHIGLT